MTIVQDDMLLNLIKDPKGICAVHGSFSKFWHLIEQKGMNKMGRNHMHFAPGYPGDGEIISGMR